jgi:hypothetical protein
MSSLQNAEESTKRTGAPVPSDVPHLTLYTVPDSPEVPPMPQGPTPPHYERRGSRRGVSAQQNQQQVLMGVGTGILCTLSVVGLVAIPFLYRRYDNSKPYFADTMLFTALLTIVAALTSTITVVTLVAIAAGFLFAQLASTRERGYATVHEY